MTSRAVVVRGVGFGPQFTGTYIELNLVASSALSRKGTIMAAGFESGVPNPNGGGPGEIETNGSILTIFDFRKTYGAKILQPDWSV